MRKTSYVLAALLGALTSLALGAIFYLGEQWAGLPFVPFDLFDWLARTLPGGLIRTFIDTMVTLITGLGLGPISATAKRIEALNGILLFIAGGALVALILALALRRSRLAGSRAGAAAGFVLFLIIAAVELSLKTAISANPALSLIYLAILIFAWASLLGSWLDSAALAGQAFAEQPLPEPGPGKEVKPVTRRAFLVWVAGGSLGVALAAWGLGRLFAAQRQGSGAGRPLTALNPAVPDTGVALPPMPTPTAPAGRLAPAPGTRPEVTDNQDFYRIDIDIRPPVISSSAWRMQVSGLFDRPRPLGLSDLAAYPAVTQPITLSCISNPVGGDLISTSYWTGARLADVLKDLGLRREAQTLYVRSADSYWEYVTLEDMMDPRTLLVYGMNGETLPVEHGFPLRIYIPNRYGMKQPKWITSIEAQSSAEAGYWVERGWSREARPQVLSIIDTVAKDAPVDGRIPVGGIAWAGDRGIRKVEVQVDGGEWAEAALRAPPLSPLTWVEWRYDWPASRGAHTLRVRATDGTGALQVEQPADPNPAGATGYHSVNVTI